MATYTIYEIPGVKIGCTDNLTRRQKELLSKGELIILETYTCIDKASERERELQREKGYPVDKHSYKYVVQVLHPKSKSKEAQKKRLANTDFKHKAANTDWERKVANTDYKAIMDKRDSKGMMSHFKRSVIATEIRTGKKTIYSGMMEAARQLTKKTGIKFNQGTISLVCNPKKIDKTHKGYKFEYA